MSQLLRSSWKRALFALALSSFGALAFAQAASAFHETPVGGTPFRVPLVPSYPACATPDAGVSHIPPLVGGACAGAAGATPGDFETTSATAGWGGQSNGFLRLQVCPGPPPIFPNSAPTCYPNGGVGGAGGPSMPLPDDRISGNIIDVVSKESGAACTEPPAAAVDDPPVDGAINDGCPQVGAAPEAGADCEPPPEALPLDDDGDGFTNDGCPGIGPYNPNPGAFWYTTSSASPNGSFPPAPACFPQDTAGGNSGTSPRACNNNGGGITAAGGVDMLVVAQIPANVGGGGSIRITDHQNNAASAPPFSDTGTVIDLPFPVPIVCRAHTPNVPFPGAYPDGGSDCGVNTTANALSPGSVAVSAFPGDVSGVVQIGQVQVTLPFEAGAPVFAVQGIFNP